MTAAGQLCTPSPSLSGAFAAIVRGPRRGARCHALPVLHLRESCRFTVLRPVRCAARPRSGACAGPARVHPAPSGREDPLPPQRTPWRAEAGDGPVRRREGLDGPGRTGRSRDMASHPRPLLRHPRGGRPPLRGHRQPVHRRWDHGALRRAYRARGSCAARMPCGAASQRSARALRARAPPHRGSQLHGPHRAQFGGGGRRHDRRRSAHGLHGAGPHGGPRTAHGAARRAREGLPDRAHGGAGRGVLQPRGPRQLHAEGGAGPAPGL